MTTSPASRAPRSGIIPKQRSTLVVPSDVLFDFDRASLTAKAQMALQEIADLLNTRLTLPVTIEGHTDSIGDDRYNDSLSRRRAEAVKAWFVGRKVHQAYSFVVHGYGKKRPVAPNSIGGRDNPEGRAKNRRVEIIFDPMQ